ncbi:hypothetical protein A6035_13900 [Dietzia lutea]|uniref:ChsH2 C-terminal OB-fold domain-containing protein n=1 Tax=Dietzia lutea TaxID=546160 RepID=A0A2S1R9X7_9ACTN|nr:hypothetical protein A6035_13900 [Dietzia lutea]
MGFPAAESCTGCGGETTTAVDLPTEGELWTWTTQSVRPPSPPYAGAESAEDFSPYLVGYVAFESGVCVEGRLAEVEPGGVRIGDRMHIVPVEYSTDSQGAPLSTFAFAPTSAEVTR